MVGGKGRGLGARGRKGGLANTRRRAEKHGGTVEFMGPRGGGTHVIWTVWASAVGGKGPAGLT